MTHSGYQHIPCVLKKQRIFCAHYTQSATEIKPSIPSNLSWVLDFENPTSSFQRQRTPDRRLPLHHGSGSHLVVNSKQNQQKSIPRVKKTGRMGLLPREQESALNDDLFHDNRFQRFVIRPCFHGTDFLYDFHSFDYFPEN